MLEFTYKGTKIRNTCGLTTKMDARKQEVGARRAVEAVGSAGEDGSGR